MSIHIRKILFLSNSSSSVCKSHICFPLSLLNFSTSSKAKKGLPTHTKTHLQGCELSPQVASQLASVLDRLENQERSNSVLYFLKESGFSNAQLEKVVRFKPELLLANVDKVMKPKFKIFQDLGFSNCEVCKVISSNPAILSRSVSNRIVPSLSVLEGLMGSNAAVMKLLGNCSWFLLIDLEKTMVPNVEFLKSCGIDMKLIIKHINYFPRFILQRPETIRKTVEKVDEMGVDRGSHLFIYAVGVVSSLSKESWELKLKIFRDFGLTEDEILGVFRRAPQVFSASEDKIKSVIQLLLATGRYTTLSIVRYPKALMYSIEKRYKPRLRALEILDKKNLLEKWPGLGAICKPSDAKFFGKFATPN